jgi:glycosyltransferase involved in cell wall biosynthesis
MKIALLIPAYCPSSTLIDLIRELSASPFEKLIVVNDGSGADYDRIFDELKRLDSNLILLEHETNQGKGAALKTGFNYLLQHGGDIDSVVTADADGQHTAEDILNVASKNNNRKTIVLGCRRFDNRVPFRSRMGNQITKVMLRFFFGLDLHDTQTGLRCLSFDILPLMIGIPYDRYEYELEMLMVCNRYRVTFVQMPISTIYINDNRSSHFNPLVDSTKIYFVLFRYVIASLLTAIVDYMVFVLIVFATNNILLSTLLARGVALTVNYSLLRLVVFQSKENTAKTFPKYILLVLASGLISAFLTERMNYIAGINVILAKAISELILYALVFWVQKTIIFSRKD